MQFLLSSPLLLLIIGWSFATFGDIFLKKWADKDASILSLLFWLSLFVYLIGIIFLAQSFRLKWLATANAIFVAINAITLVAAQVWYFQEKMTLIQLIGIVVIVGGVICVELWGVS